MARNQEKGQTLFSRWSDFKATQSGPGGDKGKRPLLQSECASIPEADKWRRDVVREITKKVTAIGNAGLGEHRIREINDEINKLMKKKYYWEMRILDLGGPDHRRIKQHYDIEGKELPGAPGYKYYGAAKDLPGVRELFRDKEDEVAQKRQRRTRGDISKLITPDYYGYRDEDDGVIVPQEEDMERRLVEAAVSEFEGRKRKLVAEVKRSGGASGTAELAALEPPDHEEEEDVDFVLNAAEQHISPAVPGAGNDKGSGKGAVVVPTQSQMEELLVQSKKAALLNKFV